MHALPKTSRRNSRTKLLKYGCALCRLSCVASIAKLSNYSLMFCSLRPRTPRCSSHGFGAPNPPTVPPKRRGGSVGSKGGAIQIVSGVVGKNNFIGFSRAFDCKSGLRPLGQWSPLAGACSSRLTLLVP